MAAEIYLVIPAYQEAATIGTIIDRCSALGIASRIIVVDDGSRDDTAAIAAQRGVTVLRHAQNVGKGACLMRGMLAAVEEGAHAIATMDGDGQHRPEDLPRLFACARAWPTRIVIGSRHAGRHHAPRARVIANRVADFWISWAARHPVDDSQSGFRVYPAELVHQLARRPAMSRGFAFESEILIEAAHLGYLTVSVDIPTLYGAALRRRSHFRPVADIMKIVVLVAGKLLAARMDPVGLWRSLTLPRERCSTPGRH